MPDHVFRQLLGETVNLVKLTADNAGDLTESVRTDNLPAAVDFTRTKVVNGSEQKTDAAAIVYLEGSVDLDPNHDHWKVEQTQNGALAVFEVVKIQPEYDRETGAVHHYELLVR